MCVCACMCICTYVYVSLCMCVSSVSDRKTENLIINKYSKELFKFLFQNTYIYEYVKTSNNILVFLFGWFWEIFLL